MSATAEDSRRADCVITPEDYFAGQAQAHNSLLAASAQGLLDRVNPLLNQFLAEHPQFVVRVNSGYRTPELNAQIPGAAPSSKHMSAQAVDIGDIPRALAVWCFLNAPALRGFALWCEDPRATPTWVHFQSVPPKSGARFFIPSPEWAKKLVNEPLSVESIRRWAPPAPQEPPDVAR